MIECGVMKYLIVAIVLFAAACRTQPLPDDGGSAGAPDFSSSPVDFASPPVDLSFTPIDFAMPSMSSCSALVQCIVGCGMGGGGQGCQQQCVQNASPSA